MIPAPGEMTPQGERIIDAHPGNGGIHVRNPVAPGILIRLIGKGPVQGLRRWGIRPGMGDKSGLWGNDYRVGMGESVCWEVLGDTSDGLNRPVTCPGLAGARVAGGWVSVCRESRGDTMNGLMGVCMCLEIGGVTLSGLLVKSSLHVVYAPRELWAGSDRPDGRENTLLGTVVIWDGFGLVVGDLYGMSREGMWPECGGDTRGGSVCREIQGDTTQRLASRCAYHKSSGEGRNEMREGSVCREIRGDTRDGISRFLYPFWGLRIEKTMRYNLLYKGISPHKTVRTGAGTSYTHLTQPTELAADWAGIDYTKPKLMPWWDSSGRFRLAGRESAGAP